MSKANQKNVGSVLNQGDEAKAKQGNSDTQMQNKPNASAPQAQSNAVDADARAQARSMATPAAPADDRDPEEKREEQAEEADRVYHDHSTNPSVGGAPGVATGANKTVAPPERADVEEKTEDGAPKAGKRYLRVKQGHPSGSFRVGRHQLTRQYEEYDLNAKEAAELATDGPMAWVEEGDEEKAKADAKLHAEIKRAQGGSASDI